MRIKPTVSLAGAGVSYVAGTEYEMDDAEADRLILAGFAIATDPNYKPKAKALTLDQKPGVPVEQIETVKPNDALPANSPAAPITPVVATTDAPKIAAAPTAIDTIKKGGK